ncbi:proline dehydrogenase [Deinococcus metallilatus]|uniref:proline dehydrogenase n=1 Tax=Deinococcus metallilatus TaxID=1211322 RepID=A0AAJ5F404_9DEIO|nr:proline dehydrogenase [Deinococcus metallilatus]MBB5294915.1 proline dehydrogenase [Deinococcus metallilatus]QBY09374.1 proline dehydrogenase [Deinococcus metallilatus]RXJ09380.1 proline dehydrogenase [Deinococcus metallilatus]TLK28902.1 proline dehydrogenase [Deinococcus metallilatus]GMA16844.1 proline dehydrogenase [Deinococcus metallilatus]
MIDQLYRKAVLTVSGQKFVEDLVRSRAWSVAQRFVAGEDAASALQAVRELEGDGILGNLDLLGEFVASPEKANEFAEKVLSLLDQANAAGIPPYVSIKLSSVGQGQTVNGEDLGLTNARRIVGRAKQYGGFVCLDMEDHPRVDLTLAQFRTLVNEFGNQFVGTVLQSYLYRSEADLAALQDLHPNLRIVKGAYLEPESVAMPDKADVDASYRRLVYAQMKAGNYVNVATHDESIIEDVKHFVLAHGISRDMFEFQMLYGIRRDLQKELAQQGYRVRAYIPYGRDWYAYFSRRIAERPANVMFVLRGMLKG